jgi:hypothetical protein
MNVCQDVPLNLDRLLDLAQLEEKPAKDRSLP